MMRPVHPDKEHELLSQAKCLDFDVDLWFPPVGDRSDKDIRIQVKICNSCPAKWPCLQIAVDIYTAYGDLDGIWGGLIAKDIKKVLQPKRKGPA